MHKEENCFISRLGMDSNKYDLDKTHSSLLKYLEENTSRFLSPLDSLSRHSTHQSWGFHKDGISIGLEVTYLGFSPRDFRLYYIDLKLVSDVIPTQGLEDTLTVVVAPFKK